jgi:hypothetical protein
MEVHILKLYAIQVWRTSEPRNNETIEVRTYNERRALNLALESYPGCNAHTLGVFIDALDEGRAGGASGPARPEFRVKQEKNPGERSARSWYIFDCPSWRPLAL